MQECVSVFVKATFKCPQQPIEPVFTAIAARMAAYDAQQVCARDVSMRYMICDTRLGRTHPVCVSISRCLAVAKYFM